MYPHTTLSNELAFVELAPSHDMSFSPTVLRCFSFFVACSLLALTASLMGILFGSFAKALLWCLFWSFRLYFGKLQKEVLSCVIVMFFCTAYTSSISIFQHNQVSPPSSPIASMQPNDRNGLLLLCRRFHRWCAGCFVPWLLCRRVCY